MSFSYGAHAASPTGLRTELRQQRQARLAQTDEVEQQTDLQQLAERARVELGDLAPVAEKAAEAAAKAWPGAAKSSFQVTVGGHRDQASGVESISLSVIAVP
jgi:hypothetical protein